MKRFGLWLCWLVIGSLLIALVACEPEESKRATLPHSNNPGNNTSDDDSDDDTADDDAADDDTADDDTADDNIALAVIYNYDEAIATNYAGLFSDEDITVTGIHEDNVTSADFSDIDVVLIDSETDWFSAAAINTMAALNLPMIGVFEGGGILFDKLDLQVGYNNPDFGETDDYATSISVVAAGSAVFNKPHDLGVAAGDILVLYDNDTNLRYHDLLGLTLENVLSLGERAVSSNYSAITMENSRYIYWGFFTNPANLTEAGKNLLANCIYFLAD